MLKLSRNQQKGSAIISALFLMGIVSMLAVTMLTRQNIEIRRTETIFQEERLLTQIKWVELWAINQLTITAQQLSENQNYISLDQNWAEPLTEFQQEGIWLSGEMSDMQAKFNINNLLAETTKTTPEGATAPEENKIETPQNNQEEIAKENLEKNAKTIEEVKKNPFDKETPYTTAWMFARLIANVSDESLAAGQGITENLIYWLKPEITEWENAYIQSPKPYRAAHQLMQSVSELRLVQYMQNPIVDNLQNYVVAFSDINSQSTAPSEPQNMEPAQIETKSEIAELLSININTTTAPVIAAVMDVPLSEAEDILRTRPYYTEEELQSQMTSLNLTEKYGMAKPMLSINSYYFLLKAVARDDKRSIVQYSLLKRSTDGKVTVLKRVQGEM